MKRCIRLKSQTTAAIIGSNDDLMTEIMIFLSPKSLLRFQLVSKSWFSLISSPAFSRRHTHSRCHLPKPPPSFILRTKLPEWYSPSRFFYFNPSSTTGAKTFFPVNFPSSYAGIIQSSHGLLLMHSRNSPSDPLSFYIYNPITGQFRDLFLPESQYNDGFVCSLAFDPSRSPHYMVVCWRPRLMTRLTGSIDLYDSEFHKWTRLTKPTERSKIYDLSQNDGFYGLKKGCHYMVVHKGSLEIIAPWTSVYINKGMMPRGESNGCIYKVDALFSGNGIRVSEVSKEKHWPITHYQFSSKPLPAELADALAGTPYHVLDFIRREPLEESLIIFHVPGKFISYKPSNHSIEVMHDFRADEIYQQDKLQFGHLDAYQLVETLAHV